MTFLDKFESFNHKLSFGIEWVGLIAFVLMVIVTTVDVLGSKVFQSPLPGSLDIMMIAQLIAMSFAIGASLIHGRHIQVEFFVMLLPKKMQHATDLIVNLLGLILFVLIAWHMFQYGQGLKIDGEVSSTIRMPLFPFVMASAIACIPVCLIYLQFFFQSLQQVLKK